VNSPERLLFVRNCRERTSRHFLPIIETSKRSKDVEKEWPD